MQPIFQSALVGLCAVNISLAIAQDAPSQPTIALAHAAVLIRQWPVMVAFGFNADDRFLVYSGNRRVFEKHDLSAANANAQVSGWNHADPSMVVSGAFSRDRRTLATVSLVGRNQSRIFLRNSSTGERIGPNFATTDVAHVTFSPDAKSLAGIATHAGTVRVWDVTTGEMSWTQPPPKAAEATWTGIDFSPDGRHLAARNDTGTVLWDVAAKAPTGGFMETGEPVSYLTVSPDWKLALGSILDTNANGGRAELVLLDISDPAKPRPTLKRLSNEIINTIETGAFSSDGRFLALLLQDKSLRVWYTASGCVVHQTQISPEKVIRLAISPNAQVVATWESEAEEGDSSRGVVRLWDLLTGQPCSPPQSIRGTFQDWQFEPGSRFFWVTFAETIARPSTLVWKLPTPKAMPARSGSKDRLHSTPKAPEAAKAPESIDVRNVGFNNPRAALWDKVADAYLVSNINGDPLEKDNNGFISRVRPDGTVESLKWITGASDENPLHAPKGMVITREVLWVADMDVVRKFDRATGRPLGAVAIPGALALDSITGWAEGGEGAICVIDTGERHESSAGVITDRDPRLASIAMNDEKVTVLTMTELAKVYQELRLGETGVSGDDSVHSDPSRNFRSASPFGIPRGIGFAGAGFALTSGDRPFLYLLAGRDGGGITDVYQFPKGQLDGVVVLFWERMRYRDDRRHGDNSAGLLVSSWEGRCVYAWSSRPEPKITELVSDIHAPGSLGFDLRRNRVLIPLCLDDALLLRPGPP